MRAGLGSMTYRGETTRAFNRDSMKKRLILAAVVSGIAAIVLLNRSSDAAEPTTGPAQPTTRNGIAEQLAIVNAVSPSLVTVQCHLRYDKGETPANGAAGYAGAAALDEERPLVGGGFLISPTLVMCQDLIIHPRFIEKFAVKFGDQVVTATPYAYAANQQAMVLQLSKPMDGARPLAFDAKLKGPYSTVVYEEHEGGMTVEVGGAGGALYAGTDGGRTVESKPNRLIVDRNGAAVGLSMNEEMPADDSWKGSPLDWEMIPAEKFREKLARIEAVSENNIVRVALSFRSPRSTPGRGQFDGESGGDAGATEQNVLGIIVADVDAPSAPMPPVRLESPATPPSPTTQNVHRTGTRILVLANLKSTVTARLQRITLYPPGSQPISATFVATLKDWGGFVAQTSTPLTGGVRLATDGPTTWRYALEFGADITLQGENRTAYYDRARINSCEIGQKGRLYPSGNSISANTLVFDAGESLMALPIETRKSVASRETYRSNNPLSTSAGYLATAMSDLSGDVIDKNNVPLSEDEENRLAWMGVELQQLNKELARANNVSSLTSDGSTGGIVTFVYPDSPAAKAGIQPGDILLRLHVDGEPKPVEVQVDNYVFADQPFPWDRLGDAPEEVFDRIPTPWVSAETNLARTLTDFGFGRKYTADVFTGGKLVKMPMEITQSPVHYDSAPKFKSNGMGLTVRDITYELNHYFQRKENDAGVVVSKVDVGSRASKAGLKPFEIITHVNDKPVNSAEAFKNAIADQQEVRLAVKRWTKGRLVRVKLPEPTSKAAGTQPAESATQPAEPATAPADTPASQPTDADAPAGAAEKPLPPATPAHE